MLTLHDLQQQFQQFILSNEPSILDAINTSYGLAAQKRIQIYKNNINSTLTKALQSLFPTIQKLIGEECFQNLMYAYIQTYPSIYYDVSKLGCRFAQFLENFQPLAQLPYLSEVAQLEWAYHEVFFTEDSQPICLDSLKTITEDQYAKIKFKLHPAIRLFAFQFPVLRIWEMCNNNSATEETVNLTNGNEHILVIRRQYEVTFERMSPSEFHLLSAFSQNKYFSEACHLALQADPACDINFHLQHHLVQGTIIGFNLPEF